MLLVQWASNPAKQRVVRLSEQGEVLSPRLEECWRATKLAADSLDDELDMPLSQCLSQALQALVAHPFSEGFRAARVELQRAEGAPAKSTSKQSQQSGAAPRKTRQRNAL